MDHVLGTKGLRAKRDIFLQMCFSGWGKELHRTGRMDVCFMEIYLAAGVQLLERDRRMNLKMESLEAYCILLKLSFREIMNSLQMLVCFLIIYICTDGG
jgi:hypothetical protein